MNPYPKTIVCPLLRENCLSAVLRYAGFLAKCSGARLLIANFVPEAAEKESHRDARCLDLAGRQLPQLEDVHYERFELTGEPVACVCQFVKEKEADLVVLGNDVGDEGKPALGQLTRQIVDNLSCTVMVVKDNVNVPLSATAVKASPNSISPNCVI